VKNYINRSTLLVISSWLWVSALNYAYAKEITILYTGETHAMIYPCSCPKEPDGGIGRRATLIKQLKKKYPDSLVLDSGGFFAAGSLDEYTQNTQLDIERTKVNLGAMELMKYDALTIGDDEFNFGKEFLQEVIAKTNLNFLSCNLKTEKVLPYIIKEVLGTKIGVIGVTSLSAMQKAEGLKFIEPKIAVAGAIAELKKKQVGLIILLSHLGESEDMNLINSIEGIDILITGHSLATEGPFIKKANTLILRPTWQGRRLCKVTLSLKNDKIINYKVETLRLSDKISDDKDILPILPRCFSDSNCKKEGLVGICENAGSLNSHCLFSEANKINLLIITTRACITCDTETVVNFLKRQFPGSIVSYLYYPDKKSEKLIKDFGIYALPAYLLAKEIDKEKNFDNLKENLQIKGDFYMLKPQVSGISYFLKRKKIKGKLDLILSLYDKNSRELLDTIKEFNPSIHFLAIEQDNKFDAARGNLEVEEYKRAVCVQKYYPQSFWDYITCRSDNINSSWWEDCATKLDGNKIKSCAKGSEGSLLLRENISLNGELQVMFGPIYLLDNQEIFSSKGVPKKEELKKIIKR